MPSRVMTGPPDERSTYVRARTVAGVGCFILAAIVMLLDAVGPPDYHVDSIQLAFVLGTGLVLLGVDAGRRLFGGGGS